MEVQEVKKVGFPSIEKPHYKYYRSVPIREIDVNQTLYQLVFNANSENMEYHSIGYFWDTWTYEKLKSEVDKVASAYKKLGIRSGDVVTLGVINTPEVPVNLLALNKIGAISKWLDIRLTSKSLEHYLCEHNSKIVVASDLILQRVKDVIDNTDVKKVLNVSILDSLSVPKKSNEGLENVQKGDNSIELLNDSRFVSFNDFAKTGDKDEQILISSFDKEKPSVIIQSSGTTGVAKSIVHSDYSFTSSVKSIAYSDLPFAPGKTLLVVVPPWVGYGLANSLFLSLSFGMKAELCPKFDPDAVYSYLGKFDFAFAAPFHYRHLVDNIENIKKSDLEKIKCLISGGDKITIKELEELKEALGLEIINGYGNNEVLGASTFNPYNHNKFGTVGIPKYGDDVIIYDNENNKELNHNEVGEVCIKTNTMCLEYSGNQIETSRIKQLHADGNYWVHTGDLGSKDEEGFLNLDGRIQRVIVRGGFKISPITIEKAAEKHPAVKECLAIAVEDEKEGNVPMLFTVLKDEYLKSSGAVEVELRQKCEEELKENEIPKYFAFINQMPYTNNNKHDFKELEKVGNDFVNQNKGKKLLKNK